MTNGLDVVLIRRMLLIDEAGNLILSPLVEMVQTRHFNPEQIFHEFELDRMRLLHTYADTINLNIDVLVLFSSHGDVFQFFDVPKQATIPDSCEGCHFEHPPLPDPSHIQAILSYSRFNFPLPDNQQPVLAATTWENEAQLVTECKINHHTWQSLKALWHSIQ